jgi:DNA-binding CsgD family transcriptional regulator
MLKQLFESGGFTITTLSDLEQIMQHPDVPTDFLIWSCPAGYEFERHAVLFDQLLTNFPLWKLFLLPEGRTAVGFNAWRRRTRSPHAEAWHVLPTNIPAKALPHVVALALIEASEARWRIDTASTVPTKNIDDSLSLPLNGKTTPISDRERQILMHLMSGNSNKIIGRHLNITEGTVKVHVKSVLRKINVRNRTQAAMWAREHMFNEPMAPGHSPNNPHHFVNANC